MENRMADQWYYSRGGSKAGPVSVTELKQLAGSGQLSPTDMVWKDGLAAWVPASSLKGLFSPNLSPLPVPSTPVVALEAPAEVPSDAPSARAAITATEFGLSATMLGGIALIGQLPTLIGAMAAAATQGGGTAFPILVLVLILLVSIFAGFLAVVGLVTAIRKKQAGGTYCVVGICVSALAFITSILMIVAISGESKSHRF
jgi:hypothetical protein